MLIDSKIIKGFTPLLIKIELLVLMCSVTHLFHGIDYLKKNLYLINGYFLYTLLCEFLSNIDNFWFQKGKTSLKLNIFVPKGTKST